MTEVTGIDPIDVTVSDLARSRPFRDRVLRDAPGLRRNTFTLAGDPHGPYFHRLSGFGGCATFFTDPDGLRLEVTNWRLERRQRAAHWEGPQA